MKERLNRGSPPSSALLSKSHDHMGKGQTVIMKTDWSQQHPHTWQTGRSAPCSLFRHGLSLTAEGRRHFHQFICLGVWTPPPSPTTWRHLKWHLSITADFEKMLQTRLLILCFGMHGYRWMQREYKGSESAFSWRRKKKNTCITDRVFGLSPVSEGTFPSPVLQPRHQGLSVKDVLTVSCRLSQPLSCLGKVSYASSIPFCCLFCTLFNTLQTDAMDLSFWKGLTGLISSQLKKKKTLLTQI